MSAKPNIRWIPWREDFRTAFRLAPADWRAPKSIRSVRSAGGTRMSWEGVFVRPDDVRVTLTTKMSVDRRGDWGIDEERLDIRLFVVGGGA